MGSKAVSGTMRILLLVCMLTLALNIRPVKSSRTIYIRADGSVDPPGGPISSVDNITYAFTNDIYDSIVVERDNITVDGAGHTVQGTGSGRGIGLSYRSNVTIKNVEIEAFGYGIYLYSSSNNTICGNDITANNWSGIYLDESSNDNTICENNITNNSGTGIYFWCSSGTIYGNNIRENNGDGISFMFYCTLGDIYGKNITANNGHGIYSFWTGIGAIYGKNITANNGHGIRLDESGFESIHGNVITNNNYGILLGWMTGGETISGNTIKNNNLGIFADSSSGAVIYNNNFVDNTQQVDAWGWDCDWDNGTQGNYWSGYEERYPNAVEIDDSGIWDTPYVIDENNQDNYPLMEPWTAPVEEEPKLVIIAELPVNILVTAPNGLRVGYDWATDSVVNEIEGATCSGLGEEPQEIIIPSPLPGVYIIDRFETGTGTYTVLIKSVAPDGATINTETWTGTTSPGELDRDSVQMFEDGSIIGHPQVVIPEVPLGTVMASAAMIIALVSYIALQRRRRRL